ncbi:50S ribosomal protein L21 [Spiroplasma syrphidicola EA-1]|uniref:Large ribosomal subunit protein bL21 n=1 Tax=Spiroplasma syrphidicola EA-1 TaxID=1276229 RepID=R4UIG1_9MOLU|nr:50S ribosomal protein L21 [Spiroplasma syrphidicola EA-1]
MFAIIKTGGKQIKVSQGDEIFVEMLTGVEGDKVRFDEVLMIDGKIGSPTIKGAAVTGVIMKQGKQKKIVVFHYKPKKNVHKKYGHRQPYTKVKIEEISLTGASASKTAPAASSAPAAPKAAPAVKPAAEVKPVGEKVAEAKPATVSKPATAKPAAPKTTTTTAKPKSPSTTAAKTTAAKKPAEDKNTDK